VTSAAGVFAAGNLIHAAEIAASAALSGRRAARHIVGYLSVGAGAHTRTGGPAVTRSRDATSIPAVNAP
jgi:hypothetical protein